MQIVDQLLALFDPTLCHSKVCGSHIDSSWVTSWRPAAAETHDGGSQQGKANADPQELHDCAVVWMVFLG